MNENIDYEMLRNSILENLDDSIRSDDIDVVLNSAEIVWDDTAIRVKSNTFEMIFDLVSYELLQYIGLDIGE